MIIKEAELDGEASDDESIPSDEEQQPGWVVVTISEEYPFILFFCLNRYSAVRIN